MQAYSKSQQNKERICTVLHKRTRVVQLRTGDISASHASGDIGDDDGRGGTDVNRARYLLLIVTSRSRISAACRARLSSLLPLSFKQSSRCDRRSSTPDVGVGVPALAVTSRKLGSTGNVVWSKAGDDGGVSLG